MAPLMVMDHISKNLLSSLYEHHVIKLEKHKTGLNLKNTKPKTNQPGYFTG